MCALECSCTKTWGNNSVWLKTANRRLKAKHFFRSLCRILCTGKSIHNMKNIESKKWAGLSHLENDGNKLTQINAASSIS